MRSLTCNQTISCYVLTTSYLNIHKIEKEAFKQGVKKMSRDFNKEQNFEEAVKESYKVFSTKGLPCEVIQLLDSQRGKPLSADSTEFEYALNARLRISLRDNYSHSRISIQRSI